MGLLSKNQNAIFAKTNFSIDLLYSLAHLQRSWACTNRRLTPASLMKFDKHLSGVCQ